MKHRVLVTIASTTLTYVEMDIESVGDVHNLFHEGGRCAVMNAGHIVDSKVGEDYIEKISPTNGQPDRSQCG